MPDHATSTAVAASILASAKFLAVLHRWRLIRSPKYGTCKLRNKLPHSNRYQRKAAIPATCM